MRDTNKRNYRLEGSTDIGGFSPWLARSIWSRYAEVIDALEVIAWRWSTPQFVKDSASGPECGLPISRLHGPMMFGDGKVHALNRVHLYDAALMPDQALLSLASKADVGVLIHAPHAANGFYHALQSSSRPKAIYIENHTSGEEGLRLLLEQAVRFTEKSVPIRLMIDIAHYLAPWESLSNYARRFDRLLEHLSIISKVMPVGIHFPIGDHQGDSLDLLSGTHITDRMLSEFCEAIAGVETVVFEYQSSKRRYLLPPTVQQYQVWQRLDRIMDRLTKSGLV